MGLAGGADGVTDGVTDGVVTGGVTDGVTDEDEDGVDLRILEAIANKMPPAIANGSGSETSFTIWYTWVARKNIRKQTVQICMELTR